MRIDLVWPTRVPIDFVSIEVSWPPDLVPPTGIDPVMPVVAWTVDGLEVDLPVVDGPALDHIVVNDHQILARTLAMQSVDEVRTDVGNQLRLELSNFNGNFPTQNETQNLQNSTHS